MVVWMFALASAILFSPERSFPVGYRTVYAVDNSRTWRTGANGNARQARPIRIEMWYPAQHDNSPRMTLGAYAKGNGRTREFLALDSLLFPRDSITIHMAWAGGDASAYRQLIAMKGIARRDPRPATGRFPLILYSSGTDLLLSHDNRFLAESLARRGYVVVSVPRLGASYGRTISGDTPADLSLAARDLAFAAGIASALPFVTREQVAVIGNGSGAAAALTFANAWRAVSAVVTVNGPLADSASGEALMSSGLVEPAELRAPILAIRARTGSQPRLIDSLWFADRYVVDIDAPVLTIRDRSVALARIARNSALKAGDREIENREIAISAIASFLRTALVRGRERRIDVDAPGASVKYFAGARIPGEEALEQLIVNVGPDSTVAILNAALKRQPSLPVARAIRPAILSRIARDRLAAGDVRPALDLYLVQAALFPNRVSSFDALADTYRSLHDSTAVVSAYRNLLDVIPRDSTLAPSDRDEWRSYAMKRITEYTRRFRGR